MLLTKSGRSEIGRYPNLSDQSLCLPGHRGSLIQPTQRIRFSPPYRWLPPPTAMPLVSWK